MMIVMKEEATPDQIEAVVKRVESTGARTHVSVGELVTVIGAIGDNPGPGGEAGSAFVVHAPFTGTMDLSDADARLTGEAAGDHAGVAVCAAGDVDGDGLADLIVGAAHGYGLDLYEQRIDGGTRSWVRRPIDPYNSQYHDLIWADIDGDGACELITGKRVRGHGGLDPGAAEPACLFYYTWDARASKFIRHTISPPGAGVGTGMQICVADLNVDRRPDIAVAGKSGTWLLINEASQE